MAKKKTKPKRTKASGSTKRKISAKRQDASSRKTKAKAKPKPKKPQIRYLELAAIAKRLQVTKRQVQSWMKDKGCPVKYRKPAKGKGGHKIPVFALAAVQSWMKEKGLSEKGAPEPAVPIPPSSEQTEKDLTEEQKERQKPGLVGAAARLRFLERAAYQAFGMSMRNREAPSLTRQKEEIYIKASEALRKLEKEMPKILEDRGEAIPLETVIEEASRIDLMVKTSLLAVPRKLALAIANVHCGGCEICKKKKEPLVPAQVETVLRKEIDDILRSIASGESLQEGETPKLPSPEASE